MNLIIGVVVVTVLCMFLGIRTLHVKEKLTALWVEDALDSLRKKPVCHSGMSLLCIAYSCCHYKVKLLNRMACHMRDTGVCGCNFNYLYPRLKVLYHAGAMQPG